MARTVAFRALPPLNPNQPNQIKTVPRKTRVVLWGFPCETSPWCLRLPRTKAYARADQPEAMWTGPPPAKSRDGSWKYVRG